MKFITTVTFILLLVDLKGQIIDFSKKDSILIVRQESTFTRSGNTLFSGVIRHIKNDEINLSYYKNGFVFVDSCFYLTKLLKSVIHYNDNKIADKTQFDKKGHKFQKDSVCLDSNGLSKSKRMSWFPNGKLWKLESFCNKQKDGFFLEWDQNGKFIFVGEYKKGIKCGTWMYYSGKTGQLINQIKY